MSDRDLDSAIQANREAIQAFMKGDARPVANLYSDRDDVTLANPLGPPRRGHTEVRRAIEEAAANFEDGSVRFEEVSRYATPDLGYVVEIGAGGGAPQGQRSSRPITLRVTMIFRPEGDTWKVVHRHADPITTTRAVDTVIESRSR